MKKAVGKQKKHEKSKRILFFVLGMLCVLAAIYQKSHMAEKMKTTLIFSALSGSAERFFYSFSGQAETKAEEHEIEEKVSAPGKSAGIEKKLRVLIKTEDFRSLFHSKLCFTSDTPYIVSVDKKETEYAAGKRITFLAKNLKKSNEIWIYPKEKGRIKLLSLKRKGRNPSYRGKFQVQKREEGLTVVNELSLEQYLYAVLPSEMSTSSPIEALKAQAVCARTYAYNQLKASRYDKYDAMLDDSDACQVYNNFPEDKRSRKAVEETRGIVVQKNGKTVPVYYYSTSWGYTASGREVWNTAKEIPHLQGKAQWIKSGDNPWGELSKEEDFEAFLKNSTKKTYDSSSPWYRWQISCEWKSLRKKLSVALISCHQESRNLVLQRAKGQKDFVSVENLAPGEILGISVGRREKSGLVTELVFHGKKADIKVRTQYLVRKALSPACRRVLYGNGKSHTGLSILPSAAFYFEKSGKKFLICGGGFGHGTGMSQWGAKTQAESGFDYKAILKHYFQGVFLGTVAE